MAYKGKKALEGNGKKETDKAVDADLPNISNNDLKFKVTVLEKLKKELVLYKFLIIGITTIFLGIVFLIVSLLIEAEFLKDLIRDLGIALVPAGIIVLIFHFMLLEDFLDRVGKRDEEAINNVISDPKSYHNLKIGQILDQGKMMKESLLLGNSLSKFGIENIYSDRPLEADIISLLKDAPPKSTIKMLGIALMRITDFEVFRTILDKIKRDECILELLTLDPESEFVKQRAKEENRSTEELIESIDATNRLIDVNCLPYLKSDQKKRFKRRYYDAPAMYFMIITNDRMVVGFYLRTTRGENSPHLLLEMKNTGIYSNFLIHFNDLWESVAIKTIKDVIKKLSPKRGDSYASVEDILEGVKESKNAIDEDEVKNITRKIINRDKDVLTELMNEEIYSRIRQP